MRSVHDIDCSARRVERAAACIEAEPSALVDAWRPNGHIARLDEVVNVSDDADGDGGCPARERGLDANVSGDHAEVGIAHREQGLRFGHGVRCRLERENLLIERDHSLALTQRVDAEAHLGIRRALRVLRVHHIDGVVHGVQLAKRRQEKRSCALHLDAYG